MTNLKISQLTDATEATGDDELAIVQSGVTKRVTAAELKAYIFSSGGVPIEITYAGLPVSTEPAGTPSAGQTYLFFSEGAPDAEPYGVMLVKDENGNVFNILVDTTYTWFNQVVHPVGADDYTLSTGHPAIAVFYRDNATPGHIVLPAYDDDKAHEYRIYNIADAGVATEGPLDIYETPSGGGTPTLLTTIDVNEVVRCYVPHESLGWVVSRDTLKVEYSGTQYVGNRLKFSGTGITSVATDGEEIEISIASTPSNAAAVPFTPAGDIAATNVQLAIEELDSEKQPIDSDLTQIAGLSPTNDDIIQRKSAVWVNRSMAQLSDDLQDLLKPISPAPGRLTLETGVPISTTDQSAKATLYYTLTGRHGNRVMLYNTTTSKWEDFVMSADLSLSLASLTASTAYDIYVYSNSGTLTLEAAAWSGATPPTRAIEGGWYVKSADKSRLLLGSIYINSSGGQTDDAVSKRFVYNLYNQTKRFFQTYNTTASWTGANTTTREYNAGTGQVRGEFILGVAAKILDYEHAWYCVPSAGQLGVLGIGIDGVGATNRFAELQFNPTGVNLKNNTAQLSAISPVTAGYHYVTLTEYINGGTLTNYGGTSRITTISVEM